MDRDQLAEYAEFLIGKMGEETHKIMMKEFLPIKLETDERGNKNGRK